MYRLDESRRHRRTTARGVRGLALLALAALVAAPACANPAYSVGSFVKPTGNGTDVVPHGLGQTPKAILLWTNGNTNESFDVDYHFALGVSDGTVSRCISAAAADSQNKAKAGRRMANIVLSVADFTGANLADATLQSWDATNFTLDWGPNNSVAYVVHFLVIGGSGVQARVVDWTMRSGTTGTQSVTGVGFAPDAVLHFHVGAGFTSALPAGAANACLGLGAMDASGSQWMTTHLNLNDATHMDAKRYQRTSQAIGALTDARTVAREASYVSMNADGFTLNWSTVTATADRAFSLALGGTGARAGSFNKATGAAPASQAVTGIPFRPGALLLASFQDVTQAAPVGHSRLGIGAAAGAAVGASAHVDRDNFSDSYVDGIDKTSKVFVKVDNFTPAIDAEAGLTSFDDGGFTLGWTTNDAVATELLYLALGAKRRVWIVADARLRSR